MLLSGNILEKIKLIALNIDYLSDVFINCLNNFPILDMDTKLDMANAYDSTSGNYTSRKLSELKDLKEKASLLILTATKVETEYLHKTLQPIKEYGSIIETYGPKHTYYLGIFGSYIIVHVQCEMGSGGSAGSSLTLSEAIGLWEPKAIIMIGIAFGASSETQKVGDVLISEGIIPYEKRREGESQSILRNPIPEAGQILLDRFKSGLKNWEYSSEGNIMKAIPGYILSGDVLIDSNEFKQRLLKKYPTAKGGEMEGSGLYAAAREKNIEWIIVKGICDFADGQKSINKDKNQKIAIESAISLCWKVLLNKIAFRELDFISIDEMEEHESLEEIPKSKVLTSQFINDVLFLTYRVELESYYYQRDIDQNIVNNLNYYNIWISGNSGTGKTTSVLRNLLHAKKSHFYIDLAKYIKYDPLQLLNSIYLELSDKLGKELSNFEKNSSLDECIKKFVLLFKKEFKEEEYYIYVDEIPIECEKEFDSFFTNVSALQISFANEVPNTKLKFIFSSLLAPSIKKQAQQKILEKYKLLKITFWNDQEIQGLIKIIMKELNVNLLEAEVVKITKEAQGSPRFVKKFFRDYMVNANFRKPDINKLLNTVTEELKSYEN